MEGTAGGGRIKHNITRRRGQGVVTFFSALPLFLVTINKKGVVKSEIN
jgi:hypothetical protein